MKETLPRFCIERSVQKPSQPSHTLAKDGHSGMTGTRETIDIEQLLIWAYRDQQVDRMAGQMRRAISGPRTGVGLAVAQSLWALGTRVDSSGALLAAIGATAPDDALVVHDAVLALSDMWIEVGARGGDLAAGEVAVWERGEIEAAGWSLRETARGWAIGRPDAREIGMVRDVPVTRSVATTLVVCHARAGDRPEVFAGWRPARGRPGARSAVTEADVVWHRAVYCVWHAALAALAEELDGALSRFAVTGPGAPEAPWERQAGRVLTGSARIIR